MAAVLRVGFIAIFILAAVLTFQGGWQQLAEYHWQLEGSLIAVALALFMVATLVGNLAWLLLMRSFGAPIDPRAGVRVYCTSNLGKYLPGKVWHVFARVYLAQQYGAPLARATTGSVTDVLIFVSAGAVFGVLALPGLFGMPADNLGIAGLGLATGLAILGLLHPAVMNWGIAVMGRFIPRLTEFRLDLGYGAIARVFALDLMLWALISTAVYATVRAVYPLPLLQMPTLAAIYAVSYISGLIMPLAPAGLGVREGAFALLLSPLVGVPAAAVATALIRVLQVAAEGVCAAACSRL